MNTETLASWAVGMVLVLAAAFTPAWAFDHTHRSWGRLLERHVVWNAEGTESHVDYAGFQADKRMLESYLDSLSAVTGEEFSGWGRKQRLAFLINAYNAFTVELVLTRYPNLQSIKDLGSFFSSPWKKRFFVLLDAERSLDEVEHGIIRRPGAFDEPRIHFAVNCASIGCPALRHEPFIADRLDSQLEDSVRRFLSDRSRNRYNVDANALEVSAIFKWYGADFEPAFGSVRGFLARYARLLADTEPGRNRIRSQQAKLRFLNYDWTLNSLPEAPAA